MSPSTFSSSTHHYSDKTRDIQRDMVKMLLPFFLPGVGAGGKHGFFALLGRGRHASKGSLGLSWTALTTYLGLPQRPPVHPRHSGGDPNGESRGHRKTRLVRLCSFLYLWFLRFCWTDVYFCDAFSWLLGSPFRFAFLVFLGENPVF